MNIPSPRAGKRARIEIIPLIDIVFFLLATFVMVSLAMVKNNGIAVNLPVATTGEPLERADQAVLTVSENGSLFFNKELTTMTELPHRIAALKLESTDPKVFINGDDKAAFGQAIAVLDEVRKGGITKVAIETKSAPRKAS